MIAIIDYGVGNLFSLTASLKFLGTPAIVTGNPDEISRAEQIILPGVGAFGDAMDKLKQTGLDRIVMEEAGKGTPLLGICLGMQMLLDGSDEYGNHKGLGLIPGFVTSLVPYLDGELKVPHIGWNSLDFKEGEPLFKYIKQGQHVYYVHSYFATQCEPYVIATSSYKIPVTGALRRGNVMGTQFHPEKSGDVGLNILRAFVEMRKETL
jgi:imidazole glycerol-phosphate synthase subunit HisH